LYFLNENSPKPCYNTLELGVLSLIETVEKHIMSNQISHMLVVMTKTSISQQSHPVPNLGLLTLADGYRFKSEFFLLS